MSESNLKYRTQKELCRLLDVSRTTLWRLRKEEGFPKPVHLVGKVWRWKEAEVLAWIEQRRDQTNLT